MPFLDVTTCRWANDCHDTSDPGAQAAVRRMERNALIFSGGQKSSPRYQKVSGSTSRFTLFSLQGQLPIVQMKDHAVHVS